MINFKLKYSSLTLSTRALGSPAQPNIWQPNPIGIKLGSTHLHILQIASEPMYDLSRQTHISITSYIHFREDAHPYLKKINKLARIGTKLTSINKLSSSLHKQKL